MDNTSIIEEQQHTTLEEMIPVIEEVDVNRENCSKLEAAKHHLDLEVKTTYENYLKNQNIICTL